MTPTLLGIDNGSTVSKVALFSLEGAELGVAARRVALIERRPGFSERDAAAVWSDTAAAIRELLASSGVDPAGIACVACTGLGNGLILIDEDGRPVRLAINSTDSRAQGVVDRWRAEGVDGKVLPKTTQSLWPAQPNALLSWLREHEPAVLERAAWLLMSKDYTRFRLCGEINAELTDMSGTSLMNVVTGQYDDDVLELFGIADMKRLLPPLVESAEICGQVTPAAAAETGLRAGTPVAGGMFDIDACALASGIVDERRMSLVAGTWGNNQFIAQIPLVDPDLFMTSRYSIPGWFLMLEGSPTSAGNLEWFVREFLGAGVQGAGDLGGSVYDECSRLVASVGPGESSPTFLPFLYGSNATPGARSCLVGLEGRHTRAHVLRAVYEGIVFAHYTHYRRLLQFRPAPDVICFTGGAARSEVWVQMFADCLQVPVEIPAGTELGALGAAIAAAVASGCYAGFPEAVAAMTRTARRQEPAVDLAKRYADGFERYCKVIDALKDVWDSW